MTDEEMANKHAEEYVMREDVVTENDRVPFDNGYWFQTVSFEDEVKKGYKDGFLAGLKAGRPQWHDLRKDPNDLPKVKKGTSCTPVIILDRNKCFSVAHYCTGTIAGAFMIDGRQWETISWCEIPTFDKE